MGYASSGGTCPLCRNYASFTAKGTLYRHPGNTRALTSARRLECRASGATLEVARRLRANQDAGRHAHRNEDGSWIYVCARCGRQATPDEATQPGDRCTPKGWPHCTRPPLQLPIKEARNEE